MIPQKKVNNLFTIPLIYDDMGIFSYLANALDSESNPLFPDTQTFINSDTYWQLDIDFEIGYSADKYFSPLALKLIKQTCEDFNISFESFMDGTLNDTDTRTLLGNFLATNGLVEVIYNRFHEKWVRIYNSFYATYNPIDNYNMLQERTPDLVDTTNGGVSSTSETNGKRWGFNSTSATNPRPTDRNDGTSKTTTNSKTTYKGKDTITRKGNIGVTTTQQMIESELELRKHDFYEIIFKDIDSILCLEIY